MGCNSCSKNFKKAFKSQPDKISWFLDGVSGLYKCLTKDVEYTPEQISANRDVCRTCEHSTRNPKGNIFVHSQCMAIDPATNAPCGCFILCKTQVGECPLGKWVTLTVESKDAI